MTHLFITTVEMQVFLQQNNISVIPWLSKTTIIVIVYALGKPHPKSGTIRGWKEQLLTFQDNHYDLAADMTQHDEPDNKKGGGGAKQHGQVSNVTSRHQPKRISKGRDFQHTQSGTAPYELHTESLDRTPDQHNQKGCLCLCVL